MAELRVSPELAAHYQHYAAGASEWARVGALNKADNVVALCSGVPHERLLEIGAGEGALLARLAELGFGAEYHALEISETSLQAIRARRIRGLTSAQAFDGYSIAAADASFDLAVLSHVLEHVEHPRGLLAEASRVARHVFVEVPLEDTWRLPRDFVFDDTGHINFFTAKSLRRWVQSCGLEVLSEIVANPAREAYRHRLGARGDLVHAIKGIGLRIAPRLATRLWTYHGALLCRARR